MKKLFVAAMMVLSTSAAFAGDSDALKNILKAKTYQEAEALVKSAELANDAEKAAAYEESFAKLAGLSGAKPAATMSETVNKSLNKEDSERRAFIDSIGRYGQENKK